MIHAWFPIQNRAFKTTFISAYFSVFSMILPAAKSSTRSLHQILVVPIKNITAMFTLASSKLPFNYSKYYSMTQNNFPNNLALQVPSYGLGSFILILISMTVELCMLSKARFNNVMVSSWSFNLYVIVQTVSSMYFAQLHFK